MISMASQETEFAHMQHSLCLFTGILVVAFQSGVMGEFHKLTTDSCFNYYGRKIPISQIDSYTHTIGCPKPGIIFTTKKGNRICVDPQLRWVKSAMRAFDNYFLQDRCLSCGTYTEGVKMSLEPIPTMTRLSRIHSASDPQLQKDLTEPLSTNKQSKDSTSSSNVNTDSVNEALDCQTLTVFCSGNQFGQQL